MISMRRNMHNKKKRPQEVSPEDVGILPTLFLIFRWLLVAIFGLVSFTLGFVTSLFRPRRFIWRRGLVMLRIIVRLRWLAGLGSLFTSLREEQNSFQLIRRL